MEHEETSLREFVSATNAATGFEVEVIGHILYWFFQSPNLRKLLIDYAWIAHRLRESIKICQTEK